MSAPAPAFASMSEAMAMARAAQDYLAAADPAAMTPQAQAEYLRAQEQHDAISTATRARILAAFTAARGYTADAGYSPTSWLIHQTRITKAAARAHLAWSRRVDGHPRVIAALAEGDVLTDSMAAAICGWIDKIPQDCRDAADQILIAAARAGARQQDLAELAAEIYARSPQDAPDDDEPRFEDRKVTVQTTIYGAGLINGDLTPECAAVVTAVLESLSAPRGSEDTRTREQRYHDALEEAMTRLIAAGLLPDRAGQPVKAMVHVSLPELRAMDGGSVLQGQWITAVRAKWAAHRAAASVGGSDGGAWLEGPAARGMTCDASVIPVVTGEVDVTVLDDLVNLCLQLAGHRPGGSDQAPEPVTPQAREMLQHAIIGKAVDLVSGPGGLASFLRQNQLGARLAGPSLPLDVGRSADIPAAIRRAVILRDQHCRWAGGCDQPASACEVHHLTHQADGGPTSVWDCALFCFFHHHVAIHQWGWIVTLHPDGTTTARSPDGTKVFRSHGPPARPG
ncbi:MAG TPA: DUF222 domain-containing protein [Streptosporangiaceae bacterium]|nr:DUF222 domain-containing protein [Streptosporangiaceae bacterium]